MDELASLLKVAVEGGLAVLILVVLIAALYLLWIKVLKPLMDQQKVLIDAIAGVTANAREAAESAKQAAGSARDAAATSLRAAEQLGERTDAIERAADGLREETIRLGALCKSR